MVRRHGVNFLHGYLPTEALFCIIVKHCDHVIELVIEFQLAGLLEILSDLI